MQWGVSTLPVLDTLPFLGFLSLGAFFWGRAAFQLLKASVALPEEAHKLACVIPLEPVLVSHVLCEPYINAVLSSIVRYYYSCMHELNQRQLIDGLPNDHVYPLPVVNLSNTWVLKGVLSMIKVLRLPKSISLLFSILAGVLNPDRGLEPTWVAWVYEHGILSSGSLTPVLFSTYNVIVRDPSLPVLPKSPIAWQVCFLVRFACRTMWRTFTLLEVRTP
jgi:hypothetical protein